MKFDSKGHKDDKNESIKDGGSQYRINQQGAPKSLMRSSSVVCKYDRGEKRY